MSTKKAGSVLIVCLLYTLASASFTGAEYYQFVDEQGNTVFTDNLSNIPQNQREKMILHTSGEREQGPENSPGHDVSQVTDTRNALKRENGPDAQASGLEAERERLEIRRQSLAQRQQVLKDQSILKMTPKETLIHANKVRSLNREIEFYDAQRRQFSHQLKQYNNRIQSSVN